MQEKKKKKNQSSFLFFIFYFYFFSATFRTEEFLIAVRISWAEKSFEGSIVANTVEKASLKTM